jgi:hypothetical protein
MHVDELPGAKRQGRRYALFFTIGLVLVLSATCAPAAYSGRGDHVGAAADLPASPAGVPKAPTIFPSGDITLKPGESKTFQARSEGAERYEWKLHGEGGISDSRSPAILYRAGGAGESAVLSVTAYNANGASPPAAVSIHVMGGRSVKLDAQAIPAGWMANGHDPTTFISLGAGDRCRAGSPCRRIDYRSGSGWAGIYWWPLACGETGDEPSWRKARSGVCALNLAQIGGFAPGRARLSLWARGQKGGEVVSFQVGGRDILPTPACSLGLIRLEADWKRYEIDLATADLTRVVGLFAWTATEIDNPKGATFYLQDVQFEGD